MSTLIDTIIYLVAVVGIVAIIGSFFEMFTNNHLDYFKRIPNKILDLRKSDSKNDKTVRVDVYLNNMTDDEIDEVVNKIKNDKKLNEISDYINIYKTFDKKWYLL